MASRTLARPTALTPILVAAGCVLLAARTPSYSAVVFAVVAGAAGLAVPVSVGQRVSWRTWIVCVLAGVAAFAAVRVAAPWPVVGPTPWVVGASAVAAVSEEALFRRGMYAWVERLGPALAVATTAVAFALVHVPAYGWGVVPVDVGAGLLFGWQRWTTGGWSAPAVTHVAANLLQMG